MRVRGGMQLTPYVSPVYLPGVGARIVRVRGATARASNPRRHAGHLPAISRHLAPSPHVHAPDVPHVLLVAISHHLPTCMHHVHAPDVPHVLLVAMQVAHDRAALDSRALPTISL